MPEWSAREIGCVLGASPLSRWQAIVAVLNGGLIAVLCDGSPPQARPRPNCSMMTRIRDFVEGVATHLHAVPGGPAVTLLDVSREETGRPLGRCPRARAPTTLPLALAQGVDTMLKRVAQHPGTKPVSDLDGVRGEPRIKGRSTAGATPAGSVISDVHLLQQTAIDKIAGRCLNLDAARNLDVKWADHYQEL